MTLRRLLFPAAFLLFVALVLASTATLQERREPPATAPAPAPAGTPPRTVRATMPRDRVVRARAGDLVLLAVEANEPGGVEVPGFGMLEPVGPDAPAELTLLAERPGRYAVRLTETGEVVGQVVVRGGPAAGVSRPPRPRPRRDAPPARRGRG